MLNTFFHIGKTIKIEANMIPSYLFFKGTIENIEDNTLKIKIDGYYAQKDPQLVKCTITDETKSKVCLFETVVSRALGGYLWLDMPKEENISIVQRREYIRVSLDKDVNCYLIGINERKVESNKVFPAKIKDISGGGVLLNSSLSLPPGTVLVFELELDQNKFLLTIKVLRNMESEANGMRDLGCQFIGIDDGDRQKIIAYCNKEQMILKRKSKAFG